MAIAANRIHVARLTNAVNITKNGRRIVFKSFFFGKPKRDFSAEPK